jgi:hypothetical protein
MDDECNNVSKSTSSCLKSEMVFWKLPKKKAVYIVTFPAYTFALASHIGRNKVYVLVNMLAYYVGTLSVQRMDMVFRTAYREPRCLCVTKPRDQIGRQSVKGSLSFVHCSKGSISIVCCCGQCSNGELRKRSEDKGVSRKDLTVSRAMAPLTVTSADIGEG